MCQAIVASSLSRSAMESIDPQSPPPLCCIQSCGRRGYVDIDDCINFLCFVCDMTVRNKCDQEDCQRRLSMRRTTTFEAHLALHSLAMQTMEFVFGDGWEKQCPCRRCDRVFLNSGGICPVHYNRRKYLRILDYMYMSNKASYSRTPDQLQDADWDVLVLQVHEAVYVDGQAPQHTDPLALPWGHSGHPRQRGRHQDA